MLSSKTPKPYIFLGGILFSLFFVIVIIIGHFSTPALAQLNSPDVAGTGLSTASLVDTALSVINAFLALVGIIALGIFVYGGYLWMTSGGNPQRIALAKKILVSAVIGLIIILLSWAIVSFIIEGAGGGNNNGSCTIGTESGCYDCVDPDSDTIGEWVFDINNGPACNLILSSTLVVKWTDPKDGDSNIPLCRIFQAGFNKNINTTTVTGANVQIKMSCADNSQCANVFGGQNLGTCTDSYGTLDYCAGNIAALPGAQWNFFDALDNDDPNPPLPDAFEFIPPTEWEADRTYWVNFGTGITNMAGNVNLSGKLDYVFSVGNATDNTPPQVSAIYPNDGDINVCRLKPISVQFSEPMRVSSLKDADSLSVADNNYASLEISLNDGSIQPADLTFGSFIPDPLSAIYSPKKPYGKNTQYFPILRAGEDADGNKKVEGVEDINGNGKPDGIQDACGNFLDQTASAPYGSPLGDYGDSPVDADDAPVDYSFTTDNADDIQCDPQIDSVTTSPFYYDPPNALNGATGEIVINGRNFGAAGEVNLSSGIIVNAMTNSCLISPSYNDTGRNCRISWNDNQITVIAPARDGSSNGAVDGSILVNLGGTGVCDLGNTNQCLAGPNKGNLCFSNDDCPINTSNAMSIDIASPHINDLSASTLGAGSGLGISGAQFGATAGTIDLIDDLGNRTALDLPCGANSWSETYVIGEISMATAPGNYTIQIVRQDGRHSNLGDLIVTNDPPGPLLCPMPDFCSGSGAGIQFTFTGKRFGTQTGDDFVEFLDQTNAWQGDASPITFWSDIQIDGTTPALPDNTYRTRVILDKGTPQQRFSNWIPYKVPCPGAPCDGDTIAPLCQPDQTICDAIGPTYSCNPISCRCDNNPLPKVVQQNSCTLGTQSPSPYIGQTDSCTNAGIAAKFDKDMDDATVVKANIQVDICGNDDCSIITFSDIDKTLWGFIFGPWEGVKEGFALQPNSDLLSNTTYRVTLKEVMTSAISLGGYHLDGNGNGIPDGPGPGPLGDDYSWIFKTSNDSCKVNSIALSPANMSVAIGSSKTISAIPQAENCNILNGSDYNWDWTEADNTIAAVTKTIAPNQSVSGVKAGTTTVSASILAEPAIPAGTSNVAVTNALSCSDPDIIAVWKFDEDSGSVALDSGSSGANDGILTSDSARSSSGCRFGKCLNLNGTDQYAAVNPALLNFGTGDFTVEGWIKTSGSDDEATLIAKQDSGDQQGYVIHINYGGRAYFRVNEAGNTYTNRDVKGTVFINDNKWHHIAGVRQGNTVMLYVDGKLEGATTGSSIVDANNGIPTLIGAFGVPASTLAHLNGQIDEVRIWNKALDISEIKSIYNQQCEALDKISCSDPNLKAVWKLDENSGIAANDSTNNNNDGQLNNSPTWESADCKYGKCLKFDGNDDYIKIPDSDSISMTNAITMEAWIKTSEQVKQQYVFEKNAVANFDEYTLMLNPGGIIRPEFRSSSDAYKTAYGTTNVADGNWHHIAATFDGNDIKIYNNGVLESTTPWVSDIRSTTATDLFIGQRGDNSNQFFIGSIDEPRIWDKALTQEEIISAMSQSCLAGSTGQTLQCTNDVVGVWNFDDGAGNMAADWSRNKNNGILMNNPAWNTTGCQFGNCLNFDGSDDYVSIADSATLDLSGSITLEAWIYPTSLAGNNSTILVKGRDTGDEENYFLMRDGDKVAFEYGSPTAVWHKWQTDNAALTANTWHHIAFTYAFGQALTAKMYVNGVSQSGSWVQGSGNAPAVVNNNSLRIGDGGAVNGFAGRIDEVRIYNRALSAAEIANTYQKSMTQCVEATLYCSNPELTAVWKMDEGIGVVAGDSTANNLDGALKNGLNDTGWKSGADCKFTDGKCLEFDGIQEDVDTSCDIFNLCSIGDIIEVPDQNTLDFGTGPFSIEGWIKLGDNSTVGSIIGKQTSGGNNGFVVHVDNSTGRLYFRVNQDGDYADREIYSPAINDGNWRHFAAVREGTAIRMYIDGVRAGQDADSVSVAEVNGSTAVDVSNIQPLYIGGYRNHANPQKFKGSIDELRIWNKALSDTQIASIYNQQCMAPQKGSACDDELQTPACQPNKILCESGDPDLRCSIKSCTCQEAFVVEPPPDVAEDSSNITACRNTAISVNFNENIDAATIKTAKTTVKVIDPPIFSENFDGADASPIGLAGWTTVGLPNESPHWNPYSGAVPVWTRNFDWLYEQSNSGSGLYVSPSIGATTTNYRILFDAGVFIGTEAVGFAFGYTDDKNYYELLWSDPQDEYASILPTRLVLRKKVNGVFTDLAEKNNYITAIDMIKNFVIEVRGTNIFVSSGGQTLLSYNDSLNAAILLNKVGFYTHDNDGGVFYDNLVINEIAPTTILGTVELYAYQPATGNLLADGDMERADADVWKTYITPKIVEKSTTEKKNGKQSLHVVTDDPICDTCGNGPNMGNEGVIVSAGTVNPGDIVRIHGWVKIVKGNFAISRMGDFGWGYSGATDWREFTLDSDSLFGSPFEIIFTTYGGVKDSEFYIDDVSITIERSLPVDIATSINGSQLTISPRQYLDPNRQYSLTLKGTNDAYVYDEVIKSINGTPLEQPGDYVWNGLTTGTEICKIGKAEIQFTKVVSFPDKITYKGSDFFTCAGDSCADDISMTPGNQHQPRVNIYAVNGGPLGGVMTYQWTKSTDAPFDIIADITVDPLVTAKPTNGQGVLTVDVNGGDAGAAKASANVTVALCENPWIGNHAFVPWTENNTNFSLWYCRDAGNMQDIADDLPDLTVQEVLMSPGSPKPMKEYFYYDANSVNDAIGIRVYANLTRLPLTEWLDQNANVSGGQSGMFNGWQSVRAGRSLYVSAMNDVGSGIYNNIYLISYSDKASGTLIGIYNQMIGNWKFMVNGISDADIAKLQRDIRRIDDLGKIATALENYKATNGSYPKLDAGTYLPGMSTSVWPSWQASFGNALQTSIPKDPINQLSNLIGYWKFDEGSGIAANDSSSKGNGGRLVNNPVWKTGADCRVGGCLELNVLDNDDYVIINPISDFPTTEITTAYWTKTSDTADAGIISYASTATDNDWIIQDSGSLTPTRGTDVVTGISVNDNAWHFVVVTWKSANGELKVYKDGILASTKTLSTGTTITPGGSLVMGQEQDCVGGCFEVSQVHTGTIDEVQIYNRALSGSEIALLAGGGFSEATGWNQDANSFRCDAGADFDSHIYYYQYNNANSYNLYAALEYVGPNTGNTWRQAGAPFNPCTNPSNCACYNYKVSCPSKIRDADGNTYGTVVINDQCWMKENLRRGIKVVGSSIQTNNGTVEKYCSNDDDVNCTTYGGLYQWDEAMDYSAIEGAQGICPAGWHIPKDAEQYALENYLKDTGQACDAARNGSWQCATAGTKLRSDGSSGFDGLPAGYRNTTTPWFYAPGSDTEFWSSTGVGISAFGRHLSTTFSTLVNRDGFTKEYGFSIRCLKD